MPEFRALGLKAGDMNFIRDKQVRVLAQQRRLPPFDFRDDHEIVL
jgi:hypothetical protein